VDDHGNKFRRYVAENFNQLSRVRASVKKRQTDRQTDGRATAYSERERELREREREFTFAKTVHLILSDRCHALSVCYVGVLWPNGWMNQDATCHGGGPRPWPRCVRWEPRSPLREKGHSRPQFSAHVFCAQMAGWIKTSLGSEVILVQGDIVLDGDSGPQLKGAHQPPTFRSMSIVAKRLDGSGCHLVWR